MLVFQGAAADQVADDHPSLTVVLVFEADDYHSVASEAAAPAVVAVFLGDFVGCHELEVAICTDVVVALVAFQAVESGCRCWDWVGADIAFGGEGEDLE